MLGNCRNNLFLAIATIGFLASSAAADDAFGQLRLPLGRWLPSSRNGCRFAFSPGSLSLARVDADNCVKIIELANGKQLAAFDRRPLIKRIEFSPDGRYLAEVLEEKRGDKPSLIFSEAATAKTLWGLSGQGLVVFDLAFSPDAGYLATGNWNGSRNRHEIKLWDSETGKELSLLGTSALQSLVAFSPDGRWLAAWRCKDRNPDHGEVLIWDFPALKLKHTIKKAGSAMQLQFSPDSRLVAVGTGHNNVGKKQYKTECGARVWETATAKPLHFVGGFGREAELAYARLSFQTGGSLLAVSTNTSHVANVVEMIKLSNPDSGEEMPLENMIGADIAVFSPDGNQLATSLAIPQSGVKLWSAKSWQVQKVLFMTSPAMPQRQQSMPAVEGIKFSPDGRWLATARDDLVGGELWIWDLSKVDGGQSPPGSSATSAGN